MESERTLAERDHILAEARTEAERIIQQAKQRAMEIVHQDQIVATARDEAERILQESRVAAQRRAQEADRYAVDVLGDLAQKLQVITKQVDNGIQMMKARSLANRDDNVISFRNGGVILLSLLLTRPKGILLIHCSIIFKDSFISRTLIKYRS